MTIPLQAVRGSDARKTACQMWSAHPRHFAIRPFRSRGHQVAQPRHAGRAVEERCFLFVRRWMQVQMTMMAAQPVVEPIPLSRCGGCKLPTRGCLRAPQVEPLDLRPPNPTEAHGLFRNPSVIVNQPWAREVVVASVRRPTPRCSCHCRASYFEPRHGSGMRATMRSFCLSGQRS